MARIMSANGLPLIRTPWERVRIFIGASFFVCQIFGYILIAVSASPWGKAVAIVAFFATRPFYSLKRPQSRTYVRPNVLSALCISLGFLIAYAYATDPALVPRSLEIVIWPTFAVTGWPFETLQDLLLGDGMFNSMTLAPAMCFAFYVQWFILLPWLFRPDDNDDNTFWKAGA